MPSAWSRLNELQSNFKEYNSDFWSLRFPTVNTTCVHSLAIMCHFIGSRSNQQYYPYNKWCFLFRVPISGHFTGKTTSNWSLSNSVDHYWSFIHSPRWGSSTVQKDYSLWDYCYLFDFYPYVLWIHAFFVFLHHLLCSILLQTVMEILKIHSNPITKHGDIDYEVSRCTSFKLLAAASPH